jgi:hypothetical protein
METNFKRPFAQYVKKAHKPLQSAIEDEVDVVYDDPEIGEPISRSDFLSRVYIRLTFPNISMVITFVAPA